MNLGPLFLTIASMLTAMAMGGLLGTAVTVSNMLHDCTTSGKWVTPEYVFLKPITIECKVIKIGE